MSKINIFILAGGFGTRLKSVVSDVPKPMAPIYNLPFLEYQIKEIKKYFPKNKIYLLTHHLSEIIEEYFKQDAFIEIIKENEPLGTGGSIKHAISTLNLNISESILVFNGDTYIKPNLSNFIKSNHISILASFQNNCDRFGTLCLKDNRIIDFNEKKIGIKDSYINAGCYFFKTLHFFLDTKEIKFSLEKLFKESTKDYYIEVFKYNDIFIDIGIPEDYQKMLNYIKEEMHGD